MTYGKGRRCAITRKIFRVSRCYDTCYPDEQYLSDLDQLDGGCRRLSDDYKIPAGQPFFDHLPLNFYWVQLRRIGREVDKHDVPVGRLYVVLDVLRSVIRDVVCDEGYLTVLPSAAPSKIS